MFPRSLLAQLAWSEYADKFRPAISAEQPGDGLLVRPLQRADYDKGQSAGEVGSRPEVTRIEGFVVGAAWVLLGYRMISRLAGYPKRA